MEDAIKDKLRGLPGVQFIYFDMDGQDDFFNKKQQTEIQKVINRYIKKTNHKVFIVSTKTKNNKR